MGGDFAIRVGQCGFVGVLKDCYIVSLLDNEAQWRHNQWEGILGANGILWRTSEFA